MYGIIYTIGTGGDKYETLILKKTETRERQTGRKRKTDKESERFKVHFIQKHGQGLNRVPARTVKANLVPNVNLPELFEEGEESQLQFLAATLTANQPIILLIIN